MNHRVEQFDTTRLVNQTFSHVSNPYVFYFYLHFHRLFISSICSVVMDYLWAERVPLSRITFEQKPLCRISY